MLDAFRRRTAVDLRFKVLSRVPRAFSLSAGDARYCGGNIFLGRYNAVLIMPTGTLFSRSPKAVLRRGPQPRQPHHDLQYRWLRLAAQATWAGGWCNPDEIVIGCRAADCRSVRVSAPRGLEVRLIVDLSPDAGAPPSLSHRESSLVELESLTDFILRVTDRLVALSRGHGGCVELARSWIGIAEHLLPSCLSRRLLDSWLRVSMIWRLHATTCPST